MIEAPETHQHHHSHTSHRWLDITLGISAMFVSAISLIVAVEHGRTMERLVEANSWPILQFETHNLGGKDNQDAEVRLTVVNAGVGPARVETFELWWKGKPMPSLKALIADWQSQMPEPHADSGVAWGVGTISSYVLRAGDHVDVLSLLQTPKNINLWEKFNQERGNIKARMCYCSVFDECWRSSGVATQAEHVDRCPAPAIPLTFNK